MKSYLTIDKYLFSKKVKGRRGRYSVIIQNTAILAGTLQEVGRNKNKNGTTWIRGRVQLANGFRYMLDLVNQRRLDFNYTTTPGMDQLPKTEVILVGSVDRIVFDNGYPWNVIKVDNIITPDSSLLKQLEITYDEAKEKVINKDQEFAEQLSDINFLVKKQIETVLGSSNSFSAQMMNAYGDRAYQRLIEDPWDMIHTIQYYTLEHGDKVAEYLRIPLDDPRRVHAQLRKVVMDSTRNTGDTFIDESSFRSIYWSHFFGVISEEDFNALVEEKTEIQDGVQQPIVKTNLGYHPSHLYRAEINSINLLESALYHQPVRHPGEQEIINEVIEQQEFKPAKEQIHALERALSDPIHVLTGGPGTGKTTILKAIVQKIEKIHGKTMNPTFLLISPTGKAASRMQEETGHLASTIHSAFSLAPGMSLDGEMVDQVVDKLQGIKYIIIDESSMIDSFLFGEMSKVLMHLPDIPKLLFVGDVDQLPPVGNGQVYRDIVSLIKRDYPEYFTELTQIQRQKDNSSIPEFAKKIKSGKFPSLEWIDEQDDIHFVDTSYQSLAKNLIKGQLEPRKGALTDVQILTPYSSGDKGDTHKAISKGVSQTFNPSPKEGNEHTVYVGQDNTPVRVNDRVINTVNLSPNIVNGSIGWVKEIDNRSDDVWDWSILVNFGKEEFRYPREEWNALDLAYAMTIHKSQGSEYPTVIIPILRGHSQFLSKNLLYTGATRSKDELVLMGNYNTFVRMAKMPAPSRQTALSYWLGLN